MDTICTTMLWKYINALGQIMILLKTPNDVRFSFSVLSTIGPNPLVSR